MIKQTLVATALIVGMAAPAFAADHHDRTNGRGNQTHQTQQAQTHRSYQAPARPTHTYPQPVAQRNYRQAYQPQRVAYYHPNYAPPRARYEAQPAYRRGYAWQPGYYQWNNQQQYYWTPGQYVQQPYGYNQYQPASWQLLNGLWTLINGSWQ